MHVCVCVCVCVYVSVCVSVTFVSTGRTLAKSKCKNAVCRCWHLPSNGVIAKIALRDLDLHFQGQTFQVAILRSKRCKTASNTNSIIYSKSGICRRTANVVRHDLDLYFQGHEFWNVNGSKTARASELDNCERVLRDLGLHFQGQTFSCYAFIKNAQATDVPDRFASTRTASAVELLLLKNNSWPHL